MKYLCYDTALNEEYTLLQLIRKYPSYLSLFVNTDDENIWDAAPYLFAVHDNFFELRRDELIKLDHCILFETTESLEEVCRFLQYYIYEFKKGGSTYFRIWDARVLLKNFVTWELEVKQHFFEFVDCFYTENRSGNCLDRWKPGRSFKLNVNQVRYESVLAPYEEPGSELNGISRNAAEREKSNIA